jgi:hypothetical protein
MKQAIAASRTPLARPIVLRPGILTFASHHAWNSAVPLQRDEARMVAPFGYWSQPRRIRFNREGR